MKLKLLENYYLKKALSFSAKINDQPSTVWIYQITGLCSIGSGKLEQADNLISTAIELYDTLNDTRHKNESLGLLSFTRYLKGELEQSMSLTETSLEMASERGDAGLKARGIIALLRNYLILGGNNKVNQAHIRVLKVIREDIEPLLKIHCYALSALAYRRAGKFKEAAIHGRKAFDMLESFGATISVFELEVYSCLAEVFLGLKLDDTHIPDLRMLINKTLSEFEKFADIFNVTLPRCLIWQGLLAHSDANKNTARNKWLKAVIHAKKLHLPYETGLAYYFLAKYSDRKYYENAEQSLNTVGAVYYLDSLNNKKP